MIDFQAFSVFINTGLFFAAALVIAVVGWRLSNLADQLADQTGMGEAIAGALLLGATTSLPGIVTSVTAALGGYADLATSNAIGGIAAQTTFLAIADMFYRQANLEHTAASIANMLQGTLLIILLTFILITATTPAISVFGIHPISIILFVVYIYGMRIVAQARTSPMWVPQHSSATQQEAPDAAAEDVNMLRLWATFVLTGAVVGVAGWIVAQTGIAIAEQSGLSEVAVGGVLTSVATSLPELVTSIAAVRQRAYTLAVGGIIGGNAFDTLFAAVADIAYRDGSIYHAISGQQLFFISLTILLTGVLLMGLLRRQKSGLANIGFESFFILLLYVGAIGFLVVSNSGA
jgi:cation:H+ antiporter